MALLQGTTVTGNLGVTGTMSGQGAVPIGGIVPIAQNITGFHPIPASGAVDADGWMYCNGATIPSSQTMSGTLPNLTDSRFIRGSTTGGGTGGAETVTVATTNMPSHSHGTSSNSPHSHGGASTHPGATGGSGASHSHSGTTGNFNSNHSHGGQKTSPEGFVHTAYGAATGGHWTGQPYGTGNASSNHTHAFGSGNTGNHTHDFNHSHGIGTDNHTHTVPAEGGGNAVTIIPKYLHCVYLIRVI